MGKLVRWGEFQTALDETREILNNPKTLAPFAKRMREKAKTFVEGQGEGAWAPPAESTKKKWERTGTSDITKHGEVRQSKIKHAEAQIRSIQRQGTKNGWTQAHRDKLAKLRKRLDTLRMKQEKIQAKDYAKRKIGKTVAEKGRKLMPRMPGTIRAKAEQVEEDVLQVKTYSKAGDVGYYHHTGQAKNAPQRTIIPKANEEDLKFAVDLLAATSIKPWET